MSHVLWAGFTSTFCIVCKKGDYYTRRAAAGQKPGPLRSTCCLLFFPTSLQRLPLSSGLGLSLEQSLPKRLVKPSYTLKFHVEISVRIILCVLPFCPLPTKPKQTHSLMGKRLTYWHSLKLSTVKKWEIQSADREGSHSLASLAFCHWNTSPNTAETFQMKIHNPVADFTRIH